MVTSNQFFSGFREWKSKARKKSVVSKEQQEYLGHINGQVEEVYGGHLVIKAFNREKDTIEELVQWIKVFVKELRIWMKHVKAQERPVKKQ